MLHSVNGEPSRQSHRQPPAPPPAATGPTFSAGRLIAVLAVLGLYLAVAYYLLEAEGMALWTSVMSSFAIMLAGGLLVRLTLGIPFARDVKGATYQALQAWAQGGPPAQDPAAPTQPPQGA